MSSAITSMRVVTGLVLILVISALILLFVGQTYLAGGLLTLSLALAAVAFQRTQDWQPFSFSFWVLAFACCAMFFPSVFSERGGFKPTDLIVPLVQIVMFGMGTTLSLQDFARALKDYKAVGVGMILQFTIMPITGWLLATSFQFPPEIAAGVVLIGACPGGVASNVITYLARGDVALSVTMTACSTLMSPFMTPMLMWLLAGAMIDVKAYDMLVSILNLIIVPTLAGLVANAVLQRVGWRGPWMDRLLSVLAMSAICIVVGIIVAQSRESLLTVGVALIAAALLHNAIGYYLGYTGARWFGLAENACRTVAIEVGMQNGGMATALATKTLELPNAALAGAIFGPWMNVSGAILAAWWRRKPCEPS